MNTEELIQWLIDRNLVRIRFDKFLNEQMVDITDFGKTVNSILNKLKTDSKEAEITNIHAAEKLNEAEK